VDAADGCSGGGVAVTISASGSRGVNERHFHRERFVRSELFVGIEFVREGLEVRVQTVTSILEFLHCENGGLKGVRESVGLHGGEWNEV